MESQFYRDSCGFWINTFQYFLNDDIISWYLVCSTYSMLEVGPHFCITENFTEIWIIFPLSISGKRRVSVVDRTLNCTMYNLNFESQMYDSNANANANTNTEIFLNSDQKRKISGIKHSFVNHRIFHIL